MPINKGVEVMKQRCSLPLSQIAISSIDLQRSELWWREGLGFLPSAHTRMFRGRTMSGVVRLDNAATSTRWLVGQDDWLQIEIWQYENPIPRLTLAESVQNRIGFRRCGVWVKDFEATLKRLSEQGTLPLTEPIGELGERRVCILDPDGIHVELFEQDPLQGQVAPAKYTCNAALRSVTVVTDNLSQSADFAERGLGLKPFEGEFVRDETLWGLAGARSSREVFRSDAMLLEYVHYVWPAALPRHPHARINDQGILNIAFGDNSSGDGVKKMELQAIKAGAIASDRMQTPLAGCVYMSDPQGFSYEFMWAKPGLGHRFTGYLPKDNDSFSLPSNRCAKHHVWLQAGTESVFKQLAKLQTDGVCPDIALVEIINRKDNSYIGFERLVTLGRFSFREQITDWQPGRRIGYRLLDHWLLKNASGNIVLTSQDEGTSVNWSIKFRSRVPGLGLVLKFIIERRLSSLLRGLKRLSR